MDWTGSTPIWAYGNPDWCFLRYEFDAGPGPIARAALAITASSTRPALQYVYRAHFNGTVLGVGPTRPLGDESRYDTYDLTGLLWPGPNTVGALLHTTADHRCQAMIIIEYADGAVARFGSGPDWQASSAADAYQEAGSIGTAVFAAPVENLDARRYPHGFDSPGFAEHWPAAAVREPFARLESSPVPLVERRTMPPARVLAEGPGRLVLDFGRTWAGGALIRARASAGDTIELRFGEVLDSTERPTVKFELHTGNVYRDVWTLTDGDQELETWGLRVFRYLEVRTLAGNPDLEVLAAAYRSPYDTEAAAFTSADPDLDRVWRLSADTIEALNLNLYVDSWTRERLPYEADAYLQQRAHLCLDPDPALARYSVDFTLEHRTWPTEWPLFGLLAVHDLWWTTGDDGQLREQYHRLPDLLPLRWLDPGTGLVRKPSDGGAAGDLDRGGFDRDLVDWPPGERDGYEFGEVNTVINALAYRCFRAAADLARAVGEPTDAEHYAATADRLRDAIQRHLFDPDRQAYADGLDPAGRRLGHHAIHAQLFPLWAGAVPADRVDGVVQDLAGRGMACSVYAAAFLLEGLFEHAAGDVALPLITAPGNRSWRHMLDVGAGATMEAWDAAFKPNLSHSHPWAASPAFLLPQGLFGLRPLEPGYRSFAIRPQPGPLDQAEVRLPVPAGTIAVRARRDGDRQDYLIRVPPGSTGRLALPAGSAPEIELDGATVRLRPDGRWLTAEVPLGPGDHLVRTSPYLR
ncbi:family 78 glycoside hydrolase catalytic domain [Microlunatus parietis]|uniref:alpha-L-rhamnosidase n=1 Tax=Microlunatus parietis TaxID=682979 RepID=A0A7Y9LG43_9ACTN|nr:family 78 glycoside hydrolase catalytic domain [Microlunatus parietis]NYE75493.1 alpha-L-rhamnosidase [Microlunatus parietis]